MYNNQFQNQNKYMNNRLANEYNKVVNNNIPYTQNPLLINNPNFVANIKNSDFYTRMNLEKMEQMRKIKNIKDLGLSERQLTDYIICPIVVAKEDKKELEKKTYNRENNYLKFGKDKYGKNLEVNNEDIPEFIKMLWSGRSNNPYKNILKKENYNKSFNKKEDLVVHKVTKLDKNLIKTLKDFEDMQEFIVLHNGELKIKFSKKKENKYKEKFDYINKVKYSFKFDPKNFNELKQFYKQEQKKIKRTGKRVYEMLEILLVNESLSKEDMDDINKQYANDEAEDLTQKLKMTSSKIDKKYEKDLEEELGLSGCDLEKMLEDEIQLSKNIDKRLREHQKSLGKQINNKQTKSNTDESTSSVELSQKKIKKITKVVKRINSDESNKSADKKPKKISIRKIEKTDNITSNIDNVNTTVKPKKPLISIKPLKSSKPKEENQIGHVTDDLMEKYKSRQKKIKNNQDE